MMFMNGEYVKTIEDLKRCLSLEELVYNYYSGELEIWLRKIGEAEKAEQLCHISKNNAYGTFYFRKSNAVEAYYRHYQGHCLHL